MRIINLIKTLGTNTKRLPALDFEVKGVTSNSKSVKAGFVFVAIKGNRQDGNSFIEEAIEKGAKAVVIGSGVEIQRLASKKASFVKVKDTRVALARLSAAFYDFPSSKIKVIGITGTNGKTTVTYLIESILKEAGFLPAVIGTINYRFNDLIIPSKNTTTGPVELQSMLAKMLKHGSNYAITEVSSHALDQDRTEGVNFHSAIFTNLTQDHLDYHKTFENYFLSKARLFKGLKTGSFAIINNDDRYAARLKKLTRVKTVTYGIEKGALIKARCFTFDCRHTQFLLSSPKRQVAIKTRLIGKHNVYNILAAAAWALEEGIDISVIKKAVEKFSLVPGRLERVDCKEGYSIFVDYAHTDDALSNIIGTLRHISKKKIIVVFGCGGERDKGKRPKMGKVVSELSDFAIITSDNPRSEDPEDIIKDIKQGIKKRNYCVIPDRLQAIKKSLALACPGDIVLVAGKGHETYQVLKDKTIHFDDREAIKECLS